MPERVSVKPPLVYQEMIREIHSPYSLPVLSRSGRLQSAPSCSQHWAPAAASEDGEPARGGGAGPCAAQTTGYPGGNRLMAPRTIPSNYSVAAEQPSQLPAPARAPAPQLAEGGAAEQGWGGIRGGLAASRWAAADEARLD